MTDTRHLDTAIHILGGGNMVKRKKTSVVDVSVYVDIKQGTYLVQVGSKTLLTGAGNHEQATAAANAKADSIRAMGKCVSVTVY